MVRSRSVWLSLGLLLTFGGGCSDKAPATPDKRLVADLGRADLGRADQAPTSPDRRATDGSARPDGGSCHGSLAPADRLRYLVVSHPFTSSPGTKSPDFEVLSLSLDGKLGKTGKTFQLGPATQGEIGFTPDGTIGLVALEDGSVGVFRLDASGSPTVVHAGFKAKGYASSLVVGPGGDEVYLIDTGWRDVGGGVYRLRIGCDGTLTDKGLVTASKLATAMIFLGGSRVALAARDVLASAAGGEAHLLDWGVLPILHGSADAFGDDKAIVPSMAVTRDQRYLLLSDNNAFSGTGNRVAAVEVLAAGLRAAQLVKPLTDPAKIVASPVSDVALVLEGEGDAIAVLDYHPASATAPFTLRGPLTTSSKPKLPYEASVVSRGQLTGRVIVAENLSLRQLQLAPSGAVAEVELFSLGTTTTAIPGALGIQP